MPWVYLVIAGLLEVVWAIGLKSSEGFTKLIPSLVTGAAMIASMWLLAVAVRTLPIGTAYGVWVGIGATGAAILGIVMFKEPVTVWRAVFLLMLIAAIIGLKATAPSSDAPS